MSWPTIGSLLILTGFAALVAGTVRYGMRITLADVACDALMSAGWVLRGVWLGGAVFAAVGAVMARKWWNNDDRRRRRKRARAALGARSKALRDSLVRRAREAARPSPVRRPALGGAR